MVKEGGKDSGRTRGVESGGRGLLLSEHRFLELILGRGAFSRLFSSEGDGFGGFGSHGHRYS